MKKIIVEIVDNAKEHKWRMRYGNIETEWTYHYAGILVLNLESGEMWGYATKYWSGVLPTEIPFCISPCNSDAFSVIHHAMQIKD